MMFHDDDSWSGVPLAEDQSQAAVIVPRIPVFDGERVNTLPSLVSTQHVMFGAIRGDLFAGYQAFLRVHPQPSGALDWALRALVLANGSVETFDDYTYDYRIYGWQDQAQARAANAVVLQEAGWDFSDPGLLASLVVMLDSLSLMTSYAVTIGRRPAMSALRRELTGPPFRGRRLRQLIKLTSNLPIDADAKARIAMARWMKHRYVKSAYAEVDARRFPVLHRWGTARPRLGIRDVVEGLIPQLSMELPASVRDQLVFWRQMLSSIDGQGPGSR
jgi:hypothetical protein